MLVTAAVFAASARDASSSRAAGGQASMFAASSLLRASGRAWALTLFYFLAFGGFVAMFLYLPKLLTGVPDLSKRPKPARAPPASRCSP